MDEIITGLIEKVGLDENQAQAVIAFLQQHADKLPALLAGGGLGGQASGLLGGLMSGGEKDADEADTSPNLLSSFLG